MTYLSFSVPKIDAKYSAMLFSTPNLTTQDPLQASEQFFSRGFSWNGVINCLSQDLKFFLSYVFDRGQNTGTR